MSTDPEPYNIYPRSLCMDCMSKQPDTVTMLTGYCVKGRCSGCGRVTNLAMIKTDKPLEEKCPACDGRCIEDAHATGDGMGGACRQCDGKGTVPIVTKQNRPYPAGVLMVRATLTVRGIPSSWEFNWNDRESVRRFAADSDRCIRAGGTTTVEQVS